MDVPTLTLVLGLVLLAFTANAFRPLYRPAPLAALSFFPAWLTAELALHHAVLQALAALVLAWSGAWREPAGQLGLALLALSVVLLVFSWTGSSRAGPVVDAALDEALGPRWRDSIPPALKARLPQAPERWRWALPFAVGARGVSVERDVVFARLADGRELHLDVFRPAAPSPQAPALVFAHGGGWVIGHREHQGQPMLHALAAQGWVCVSVEYRLSPRATFPDHIIDVKRGIVWVREHAAELGVDPGFLVVSGISAGGHLAALAALTPNDPEYQPGFEQADTSVAGCVPFYGIYDLADRERLWPHRDGLRLIQRVLMKTTPDRDPQIFDRASPLCRVRPDAPPFFILHGTVDVLAPIGGARSFVRALRAVSRSPVAYAEIPGGQHAFEVFHSPRADHTLLGVYRFLAWLRGRR
jgi:acetyl esterase/lipase